MREASSRHLRRIVPVLLSLAALPAFSGVGYKDYDEKFVPKSPERRRVAVAISVDRQAVERGSYETKLLQALVLARFVDQSNMEFLPRTFYNPDSTLLAQLRALDVDDLIDLSLVKLKPPVKTAPSAGKKRPEQRYTAAGTLRVINVRTGSAVVQTDLEKLSFPDVSAYSEDIDAQATSLMVLAAFMASYYQGNEQAVKLTPVCTAMEAAAEAESAGRYEDAALILAEIVRKDPSQEAALRDRRDLAMLRAGRGVPAPAAAGSSADVPGTVPRGAIDYLAEENRGKLFPVAQGHVSVRQQLAGAFSFSVGVLMKDPQARGGILIGSKTKNVFVGLTPSSPTSRGSLIIDSQNTVTGISDTDETPLPSDLFPLGRLVRLEVRYDVGMLTITLGGRQVRSIKTILPQPAVFLFGKLSTVYFQDAFLTQ